MTRRRTMFTKAPPLPTPIADDNPIQVTRSGSILGARGTAGARPTGMHFGHHKAGSPKKRKGKRKRKGRQASTHYPTTTAGFSPGGPAGMAANFNKPGVANNMASQSIPFIPDTDAFFSATMDVWP